jgi:hypothetical protein
MRRITPASEERRISGSVKRGRPVKSCSSYSRMQMPFGHAAAAAGPLVGRGLADRLHQQLLHLAAEAVALHAGRAGVDHVTDAGHRQGGLGHVGGQHDAPPRVAIEHALLLRLRQPREQRQHLGIASERVVRQVLAQVVRRLADLPLPRQEDQDVAGALPRQSSSTASAMASLRSNSRDSSKGRQRCSTGNIRPET